MDLDGSSHAALWEQRERRREMERQDVLSRVRGGISGAASMIAEAGCTEAWLVGSFGRGTPDAGSDVDIIVRGLEPRRRPDLWWKLCSFFGREVDIAEPEARHRRRKGVRLLERRRPTRP
jgi:predicted nucleotidyltransferase